MKYYSLNIDFEPSRMTFDKITDILNVKPNEFVKSEFETSNEPSLWIYQLIEEQEKDQSIDFINIFLDILEPKLDDLKNIGIHKEHILFWLVYEYQHQCAMEFHPREMKRLGDSGFVLNIDCIKKNTRG